VFARRLVQLAAENPVSHGATVLPYKCKNELSTVLECHVLLDAEVGESSVHTTTTANNIENADCLKVVFMVEICNNNKHIIHHSIISM
jgi:hypothetical protein